MNIFIILSLIYPILVSKIQYTLSAPINAVHICAYSADTSQYTPNCYDCIQEVYDNALMACVNMPKMPKNITFKAANCMEGNCKIPYFTPTAPEVEDIPPMWSFFSRLFLAGSGSSSSSSASARAKRNVKDNSVDGMAEPITLNIVQRVDTVVGKAEDSEMSLDYEEM